MKTERTHKTMLPVTRLAVAHGCSLDCIHCTNSFISFHLVTSSSLHQIQSNPLRPTHFNFLPHLASHYLLAPIAFPFFYFFLILPTCMTIYGPCQLWVTNPWDSETQLFFAGSQTIDELSRVIGWDTETCFELIQSCPVVEALQIYGWRGCAAWEGRRGCATCHVLPAQRSHPIVLSQHGAERQGWHHPSLWKTYLQGDALWDSWWWSHAFSSQIPWGSLQVFEGACQGEATASL